MVITRWDPFRDVQTLQNRLNSLFQDFSRNLDDHEPLSAGNFVPPVDIYEDEHHMTLKMEIPGIRPEDLDIQVENNTLSVRGERKFETEEKEENFHRVERRYGSFYRAFALPSTVNSQNIEAECNNGVLRLRLEKKAEAKPKQIKVNVASPGSSKQVEGGKPANQQEAKTAA